jgi:TRAP transporter TAXI family solute receptor
MNRRRISTIAQIAAWCLLGFIHPVGAAAEEARYLRVGTGPPGENHFSLGSLIASAISAPPGLPCNHNGGCGVAGLIAVASATAGSEANLETLEEGRLDAALIEADTPTPAGHKGDPVRAIANLSLDQMQLVVLKDGPIRSLRDLKGKRISLGEQGSGTHLHAHQLLSALGFKDNEVKEDNLRSALAADAMLAGKLDAFFVMDEAPVPTIAELAKIKPIRLIGVSGPAVEKMRKGDALLEPSRIPAGTYAGIDADIPTVAVGLIFVVSAKLPDDLVYGITKSLWQPETQQVLNEARRGALPITEAGAVTGLGVALHPGAQRFYSENKPVLR